MANKKINHALIAFFSPYHALSSPVLNARRVKKAQKGGKGLKRQALNRHLKPSLSRLLPSKLRRFHV